MNSSTKSYAALKTSSFITVAWPWPVFKIKHIRAKPSALSQNQSQFASTHAQMHPRNIILARSAM